MINANYESSCRTNHVGHHVGHLVGHHVGHLVGHHVHLHVDQPVNDCITSLLEEKELQLATCNNVQSLLHQPGRSDITSKKLPGHHIKPPFFAKSSLSMPKHE